MYVFVYGTLRQGDSRNWVLPADSCIAEEAYLTGCIMLDLGAFPGIIPSLDGSDDIVRGEVYKIDPEILKELDGIEGFQEDDPEYSLYLREECNPWREQTGDVIPQGEVCYTYIFNRDFDEGRIPPTIESGDWFKRNEHSVGAST